MKRNVVIAIGFVFFSLSIVAAQNKSYGIKGGYLLGNFWGDGSESLNNQLQAVNSTIDEQNLNWVALSLFSTRELLPDLFSVQSELVYLRGGKTWEGSFNGEDVAFNLFADYIQMPWLAKITLPIFLKPSIYFGPHISWMIRARIKDLPTALNDVPFFSGKNVDGELFESFTNVVDLGMTSGIDFDYELGPGNLIFDFRFTLGTLNAFNFAEGNDIRNYAFIFMLGYSIDFNGGYDY